MTDIVTSENFSRSVLQSKLPVLVDFYADWCGPCKALSPVVDQLANDFDGTAKVVKLNIDASADTASQYGVRGIPLLAVFKNGQMVESIAGVQPKQAISELLNRHA